MIDEDWYGLDDFCCSKYEINKKGDIRNKQTKKILAKQNLLYGYRTNTLVGDDGKIHCIRNHILVAKLFIPNPHSYKIVNHIDGNRDNASVDNLEWVSQKQNINKYETKKRMSLAHEIPVNEYSNKGEYIRTWKSAKRIANYYGVGSASQVIDKEGRYLKGRIFKTYNGNCDNIIVNKFKGREIDYEQFGEVNKEDIYVPLDRNDRLKEIYDRQMKTYVSQKQIKKDMEYLKQYILELREKLEQLRRYEEEINSDINRK